MKKRSILLMMITSMIAIIMSPLLALTTQAQTESEDPTQGESYVIGLDDTFAPMGYRDEAGELVGFDIDLANAMAEIYDWDITFQPIDWALKETELNSGNIDMIWNGYGVTEERLEKVAMTEPYIMSSQIVVSKDGSGIDALEDLTGKTIATQSGSTSIDFMEAWPNNQYSQLAEEPVLYPDYNQAFIDLSSGRVDSVYVGILFGLYSLGQRDDGADYQYFIDETTEEPMAVGVRKSDEALLKALNNGFEEMHNNGTYDEIYAKWFGETTAEEDHTTESSNTALAMPDFEASSTYGGSYTVGLDDTFAPMGFRDENGELVGFDIDLANSIAELYNWDLNFQSIDWALKETELNSGNIDMIWNGYGVTPEREEKVLMSESYLPSSQIVISKKGSDINELADLEGKKMATQSGSTALDFMIAWPNDLYNNLAEEPVLYPDYNQVFSDLASGRVDAIYASGLYGSYTLQQRDDTEDYQYFVDPTSEEPMAVGLRKSDTELKEAIDSGLQYLIDTGAYDEISAKWFGEALDSSEVADAEIEEESLLEETMRILPSLLDGIKMTLFIFVVVLIVSIPLGFIVGVLRVFGPKWLQAIIEAYVFVMRGSPLMLQLMLIFFGLPFIGVNMDRLPAALFAFIINYVAYLAEIFRGGISSVPDGQFESIEVLGIGSIRGFRRIILPQVFKIVMPSIGNEVIALIKDTSLVYVIGLGEMLRASSIAANREASLLPYVLAGALYLVLTGVLTWVLRKIEIKLEW